MHAMKKDIIIVDDEKDIRELISGILSDEGFETRLAKDLDSLKIELIKRVPALILLVRVAFWLRKKYYSPKN